jgi:DNA-binding CsgD family transcriptional regulator
MTREELSQFLLTLYTGSKDRPIKSFRQWTLEQLANTIPFDWACWRHGSIEVDLCRLHNSFSYRVSRVNGNISEVFELPKDFPYTPTLIHPEQILRFVKVVSGAKLHETFPANTGKGKTGDADKITTHKNELALYGVICLYRDDPQAAFTKVESRDAAVLVPHLIEAWVIKLYIHLQTKPAIFNSIGETALCDAQGAIWCSSPQFTEILREEWPLEHGHILPSALIRFINASGSATAYDGKQIHCVKSAGPTSDLFYLYIRKQPPLLSLAPRQRRIAIELAQGKTYNQIAHSLGISRSTVTNHANAIYTKLGISNKVQLAILCFGHTLQSLIM